MIRWQAVCSWVLSGALLALVSGCVQGEILLEADASGSDVTAVDVTPEMDTSFTSDADLVELDMVEPDRVQPSVCEPGDGCFAELCEGNDDCLSGICAIHMGEKVCSKTCDETCPQGWECGLVSDGGDGQYVCQSTFSHLCLPCATGEGCAGNTPNACVQYADGASFCGGACDLETPCPSGYACQEVETVTGAMSHQCVNTAGACPCSGLAIDSALSTACEIQNEEGTCAGVRVCEASGLSDCSAVEAQSEVCNGLDDDCNGVTDDASCDDGNGCTIDTCDGEAGCTYETLDAGECLDGDACTMGDHCEAGVCVGTPIDCDDANPCTADSCDGLGGCNNEPVVEVCDDGDPCTLGDLCQEGLCAGTATLTCEDNNPCTADSCGEEGCIYTANDAACDDANLCTSEDLCVAGACVGAPVVCDDANLCTNDSCEPTTGCVTVNNAHPCDDGDTCTLGDLCTDGDCASGANVLACDDNNPCTADSCGEEGCIFTANDAACDDGNLCTSEDLCVAGSCVGAPVVCDDENLCTSDSCEPTTGCVTVNNAHPCDDGDTCTLGDLCSEGSCGAGASGLLCDDGNPCTNDGCDAELGCVFEANQSPCDDKNTCTTSDTCVESACVGSGSLECDDGNPCTVDTCLPGGGCTYANAADACDDGDACTVNDACAQGTCVSGLTLTCDDGNECTDQACQAGDCIFTANASECDDGNACTLGDVCNDGWCSFTDLNDCSDDNVCTQDTCEVGVGCVWTPDSAPCDDGDACTLGDACDAGECSAGGTALECDDGLYCNGPEACEPLSGCVDGQAPAFDDGVACTVESCDEVTDAIAQTPDDGLCDVPADAICKVALCDGETGCGVTDALNCCGNNLIEDGEACDDGNQDDDDDCTNACELTAISPAVTLVGEPVIFEVFNTIERTFFYSNNLTSGIWHGPSGQILTGHYSQQGYYQHGVSEDGYPSLPDNGSGWYGRMVHMPVTSTVVWTDTPANDGIGPASSSELRIGTIDPVTGTLSNGSSVQFSDGYSGGCNVLSSSASALFILESATQVRHYATTYQSNEVTLIEIITLSTPLPDNATCTGGHCYGGTFAWDGKYFYFTHSQTGSGQKTYSVYDAQGNWISSHDATGSGGINGVYFDWSAGRYTTHDGYGDRQGGGSYGCNGCSDDSQSYGPPSPVHQ
jgi:hypothetical protein